MKVDLIFLDHSRYVSLPLRTTPTVDAKECISNMEPATYIILEEKYGMQVLFLARIKIAMIMQLIKQL